MKILYVILSVIFAIAFIGGLANWQAFGRDTIGIFVTVISLILTFVFAFAAIKRKRNQK